MPLKPNPPPVQPKIKFKRGTKSGKQAIDQSIFDVGYYTALNHALKVGHDRFQPSTMDHILYDPVWRDFMAGWKAGLKEWNRIATHE